MRAFVTACAALALLAACGKDTPPTETAASNVELTAGDGVFSTPYLQRDLDNGLRVIIVPTDYPDIVTLQIPVQTGSRNEVEPGKSGFAHFFEHMMFRGTEKYSAEEYQRIVKQAGANQNAYTTDDYTNYHLVFTKDDLEKILELEADRFKNLSYSEDVFRTEALAVKGEYLKNFSNPTSQAYERLRDLAFDRHTYGHTTMGFLEDIEQMPEQYEYSKTFFDRWYRPEKSTLILAGDLDVERTLALVEKYWSDWERGGYNADIPVEPPLDGPVYEHIQWEAPTQPWVLMGFRGPAFDPAAIDMPAIDVLASVYFSNSSDLYRKLVLEEQKVDQLLTYFPNRLDPNLLMVYARLTDASHAGDVQAAIHATLAEARSVPVASDQLAETKSRLKYGFTSSLDSSGAIGATLASFVHASRTPETINQLYATYDALTPEDVRTVANRYFTDDRRVTVTLSNAATMDGYAAQASIDARVEPRQRDGEERAPVIAGGDELQAIAAGDVPVELVARPLPSSPLVDVSFIVHAGAAYDPPGKKGLAALTAAMLTDAGSEQYTIQEINRAMYPMAAGFSNQVDKEMTRLSGQVHRDNLGAWYRLVRSQLLSPGFREQDFNRVKTQLINAVRTSLVGNNDEELGKEVLYSEIYRDGHPYGSLNAGHSNDLRALTLDDVRDFYQRHYTTRNVTLGIAGGYPDDFAALVSNDLQALPEGSRNTLSLPEPAEINANRAVIVEKETPAVAVSFGYPINLVRGDEDWVALWLVRSWLGEHRSTNGRLYQRIRETRGMNYGDYAYIEYFPEGMFRTLPGTNLGRQQQIFQVWLRPLRNNNDAQFAARTAVYEIQQVIEQGMSEQAFEDTRSFLRKFVSLMSDGQSRQLGYALDSRYYGTPEFSEYVRRALDDITLADVNRVIRENLRTDNVQYVFVSRDAAALKERLAADEPSPMKYDAAQPEAVLEEDRAIEALPLGIDADNIEIIEAEAVFR